MFSYKPTDNELYLYNSCVSYSLSCIKIFTTTTFSITSCNLSQFTGGHVETSISFQKENGGDCSPAAPTLVFTAHTRGVRGKKYMLLNLIRLDKHKNEYQISLTLSINHFNSSENVASFVEDLLQSFTTFLQEKR